MEHEIDDARLVRPDWVITKPILSGICGSDAKLVLGDFNTGDIDNPMAAFSSLRLRVVPADARESTRAPRAHAAK